MPLTDVTVRQSRPKEKEYRLSDERGLLLVVRPNGAKWWRLRYQFQGKEQMISLGVYPDVSLSMARERRDAARRVIADGKNPKRPVGRSSDAGRCFGTRSASAMTFVTSPPTYADCSKRRKSSTTPL